MGVPTTAGGYINRTTQNDKTLHGALCLYLFEPTTIGKAEIKNLLAMAWTNTNPAELGGFAKRT